MKMSYNFSSETPSQDGICSFFKKKFSARTYCVLGFGVFMLILIAVGIVHLTSAVSTEVKKAEPPDPEVPLPPSPSILHKFRKGAVCSDGTPCSQIGSDILKQNGSAVDATIATLLCNGIVNCQSMGLGGGFLMTIYDRQTKTAYTLNAREAAPEAATEDMYLSDPELTKTGPLAAGVPGELAGYWAAHQRFGRLPWSKIVEPTLKICDEGYNMTRHQSDSLSFRPETILKDEIFREVFVNPSTGSFFPEGTTIVQRQICKTLKIIAEQGGDVLYNGSLAKTFVNDVKELGGIITLQDMQNYRVHWDEPVVLEFKPGMKLFSTPPPGSGAILAFIINILNGYNFTSDSVSTTQKTALTYHHIIEAFKFAFAKRTELGDPRFVHTDDIIKSSVSSDVGNELRKKINDNFTHNEPEYYGAVFSNKDDHGTAHVSVISPSGDAVSVTSTVNLYFGAGVTSKNTGIILNSGMADFSFKNFDNYFDLPASPANKLEPRKQPLSSMCPSIVVDSNGDVRLVVGAAGGAKITTAVAYVILRHLWFGDDVKQAIDSSRIHHQLFPPKVLYEYGVLKQVIDELKKYGHEIERYKHRMSVVCAVSHFNGTIQANADYRKGGDVHGF